MLDVKFVVDSDGHRGCVKTLGNELRKEMSVFLGLTSQMWCAVTRRRSRLEISTLTPS
jgi:hypothetical protein